MAGEAMNPQTARRVFYLAMVIVFGVLLLMLVLTSCAGDHAPPHASAWQPSCFILCFARVEASDASIRPVLPPRPRKGLPPPASTPQPASIPQPVPNRSTQGDSK
jgi:hypothetical protein